MECPICKNSNLSVLSDKLRRGNGTVFFCSECQLGILEPEFDDAVQYYDSEYRKKFTNVLGVEEETPEEMYETRSKYQEDRIKIVSKYFDKEKNFLEIGSSAGQFLKLIQNEFKEVKGLELSKKCADYVKKRFNIDTYTDPIEKREWGNEKFSYISFFQVLEHIENPKSFLSNVSTILEDDGRIFIEVPNLNDPLLKLWNVPAYEHFYYHEAHLSYFTEKSLNKLFEACDLKVEEIHFIQDYNILNNLYWYNKNEPQPSCDSGLNLPHVQFRDYSEETIKAGEEINELFVEMNKKYFDILSKHKLTSNIFIVLKKK